MLEQVLGLPELDATADDIRGSYKYLAKRSHPDVAGAENSGAFALINKAYEVLSDPVTRLIYDSGRSLFGEQSAFGDFTGLLAVLALPVFCAGCNRTADSPLAKQGSL